MLEWVISGIEKSKKGNNDPYKKIHALITMMEILLKMLLSFSTGDSNIQKRYLHCFKCLTPLYRVNEKALNAVLQKVSQNQK